MMDYARDRRRDGGKMRALVIAEPWITHLLEGRKRLEFRKQRTNVRERIGLIRKGSGTVVGTCRISDCIGPEAPSEIAEREGHTSSTESLEAYAQGKSLYAWVLSEVESIEPVRYTHPKGAQSWVALKPSVVETILGGREERGGLNDGRPI